MVFKGKKSQDNIEKWLETFQQHVDNILDSQALKFTADVWSYNGKLWSEQIMSVTKNNRVTLQLEPTFLFLDIKFKWDTDDKLWTRHDPCRSSLNFRLSSASTTSQWVASQRAWASCPEERNGGSGGRGIIQIHTYIYIYIYWGKRALPRRYIRGQGQHRSDHVSKFLQASSTGMHRRSPCQLALH